jgi:hypothetical protein
MIYTDQEIAKARESPQFEREYNLQYIGQQGNVFSHESIEHAIKMGLELEALPNYYASYVGIRPDLEKVWASTLGLVLVSLALC